MHAVIYESGGKAYFFSGYEIESEAKENADELRKMGFINVAILGFRDLVALNRYRNSFTL